jgi:hypothetical protein
MIFIIEVYYRFIGKLTMEELKSTDVLGEEALND